MKNPQTTAVDISNFEHIKAIAKYGCCAFVALWCMGIEPDNDVEAIRILNDAIKAGVLDKECTVNWDKFLTWVTGRKIEVQFKNISSIKSIKKRTAVRYDYNGCSHWVGVENGAIKYNSLKSSVCATKGKPVTAREFYINGKQI